MPQIYNALSEGLGAALDAELAMVVDVTLAIAGLGEELAEGAGETDPCCCVWAATLAANRPHSKPLADVP